MGTVGTLRTMGTMGTIGTLETAGSQSRQSRHHPHHPPKGGPLMPTKIILPHGGYRNLLTYKKSDVIYQDTVVFVKRFLQRGDRTIDQMVQARRLGDVGRASQNGRRHQTEKGVVMRSSREKGTMGTLGTLATASPQSPHRPHSPHSPHRPHSPHQGAPA